MGQTKQFIYFLFWVEKAKKYIWAELAAQRNA